MDTPVCLAPRLWIPVRNDSTGIYVFLGGDSDVSKGEAENMMVPYSRNTVSSDDRNYEVTALVSGRGVL